MKNYYLLYHVFFIFSVHCQKNKKDDDKKDEEFKCPEGQGNGNFADPATCRRFYQVIYTINNLSDNNYILRIALITFITGQFSIIFATIIRIVIVYSYCRLYILYCFPKVRRWISLLEPMSIGLAFRRYQQILYLQKRGPMRSHRDQ